MCILALTNTHEFASPSPSLDMHPCPYICTTCTVFSFSSSTPGATSFRCASTVCMYICMHCILVPNVFRHRLSVHIHSMHACVYICMNSILFLELLIYGHVLGLCIPVYRHEHVYTRVHIHVAHDPCACVYESWCAHVKLLVIRLGGAGGGRHTKTLYAQAHHIYIHAHVRVISLSLTDKCLHWRT
jgi:hypothetical protein